MATKSTKTTFKWVSDRYSDSYVTFPYVEERGRVVVRYYTFMGGAVKKVIAHVWGPNAGSEATESITLTPDAENPGDELPRKALRWVEERVSFLDKEA